MPWACSNRAARVGFAIMPLFAFASPDLGYYRELGPEIPPETFVVVLEYY